MVILAQLRILSTSEDLKKDDDINSWKDVYILPQYFQDSKRNEDRSKRKTSSATRRAHRNERKVEEAIPYAIVFSADSFGDACVRRVLGGDPLSSEMGSLLRRHCGSPKASKPSPAFYYSEGKVERQGPSRRDFRKERLSRRLRRGDDALNASWYSTGLFFNWIAPRAAFAPLSKELRAELRLNPISTEPTTYGSHSIARQTSWSNAPTTLTTSPCASTDVSLANHFKKLCFQGSRDRDLSDRCITASSSKSIWFQMPTLLERTSQTPEESDGAVLNNCSELLEVDVGATLSVTPLDRRVVGVKKSQERKCRKCKHGSHSGSFSGHHADLSRFLSSAKNMFFQLMGLFFRNLAKTRVKRVVEREEGPSNFSLISHESTIINSRSSCSTPQATNSSSAGTRVWLRLRFHRKKDLLEVLRWYIASKPPPPLDMGVETQLGVAEAAAAFIREAPQIQKAYGNDSSTCMRSGMTELDEVWSTSIEPSRRWEHYLRRVRDPNLGVSFSVFPLYLWRSFMPFATYAFYSCERGFLRIEPDYGDNRSPRSAIFHRGREKVKCHDVRGKRDGKAPRARTLTVHTVKHSTKGGGRAALDRGLNARSVSPMQHHVGGSAKRGSFYHDGTRDLKTCVPDRKEPLSNPAPPNVKTCIPNQYKFDTVTILPYEKGGEENHNEGRFRENNESSQVGTDHLMDTFLCITTDYLLGYDSFGSLKFHLRLDDLSAIFVMAHPLKDPAKSVGTTADGGKSEHKMSSTSEPFSYPFIHFKVNTSEDAMNEPPLSITFTFFPFMPHHAQNRSSPMMEPFLSMYNFTMHTAYKDDLWERHRRFIRVLRALNKRVAKTSITYTEYITLHRKDSLRRLQRQPPIDGFGSLTGCLWQGEGCEAQDSIPVVRLTNAHVLGVDVRAHDGAPQWRSHLEKMCGDSNSTATAELLMATSSATRCSSSYPSLVKDERSIPYDIRTPLCLAAPSSLPIAEKETLFLHASSEGGSVEHKTSRSRSSSAGSIDLTDMSFIGDLPSEESNCLPNRGIGRSLAGSLVEAEKDEYAPIRPQRRNSLLLRKLD